VIGDRNMGGDLVFRNLGHFFAEKLSFETIVMEYRLLSHGARYPSGGDDVALVMDWIADRFKFCGTNVFLIGNSAGAVHVATYLFEQRFSEKRKSFVNWQNGVKLSGAVLLSCPHR
jgi:acetyl esterase/lipase